MRIPFAIDNIGETVQAYRTAATCSVDVAELGWARDVLSEYFHIHAGVETVGRYRDTFDSVAVPELPESNDVPYKRQIADPAPVDVESLRQLARHRRSVRWYLDRP